VKPVGGADSDPRDLLLCQTTPALHCAHFAENRNSQTQVHVIIRILDTNKPVEKYPVWTNVSDIIRMFPADYGTLLTYIITYLLHGTESFLRS
jgi:hypothetical protein